MKLQIQIKHQTAIVRRSLIDEKKEENRISSKNFSGFSSSREKRNFGYSCLRELKEKELSDDSLSRRHLKKTKD